MTSERLLYFHDSIVFSSIQQPLFEIFTHPLILSMIILMTSPGTLVCAMDIKS